MDRVLYIVRGLPGSGKSTLGEKLAPEACYAADDYFTDGDGGYHFNPTQLVWAHTDCQRNVEEDMVGGRVLPVPAIAVCNTFTKKKEAKPYFVLAEKYGYNVFVIHCQNDFGNVHNVPEDVIDKMRARWDDNIRP